MKYMVNKIININAIGPVIARGIIFLFGQLFLMPLTKLIMAIIKHGTKIKSTAKAMMINTNHRSIPTKNIPKNAMTLIYIYCE